MDSLEYEIPLPGMEAVVLIVPLAVFVTLKPFVPQLYPMPDLLKVMRNPPPTLIDFLKRNPILFSVLVKSLGKTNMPACLCKQGLLHNIELLRDIQEFSRVSRKVCKRYRATAFKKSLDFGKKKLAHKEPISSQGWYHVRSQAFSHNSLSNARTAKNKQREYPS